MFYKPSLLIYSPDKERLTLCHWTGQWFKVWKLHANRLDRSGQKQSSIILELNFQFSLHFFLDSSSFEEKKCHGIRSKLCMSVEGKYCCRQLIRFINKIVGNLVPMPSCSFLTMGLPNKILHTLRQKVNNGIFASWEYMEFFLFIGHYETYSNTDAGHTTYFKWTWYDWDR